VVLNYTEIESKVREATNDEPWGPTGPQLTDLAQSTYSYEQFPELMGMLWRRMFSESKVNYRRIYKALIVLNYLLRNGSDRVVNGAREHVYELRTLESFQFVDESGKDQGVNIRHRAKQTIEFLQDDGRVREERKKAKKNKDKYIGVDAATMQSRKGTSGYVDRHDDDDRDDEYSDAVGKAIDSDDDGPPVKTTERTVSPTSSATISTTKGATSTEKPTRSKPKIVVSKKVDLGAAADFAKQQAIVKTNVNSVQSSAVKSSIAPAEQLLFDLNSSEVPQSKAGESSLLADLFDKPNVNASEEFTEFADFNSFGTNAISSIDTNAADDFGDFESAFGTAGAPSSASATVVAAVSSNLLGTTDNHMSDLFGASSSSLASLPAASILSHPTSEPSSSNLDLLADLQSPSQLPLPSASFDSILVPQSPSATNFDCMFNTSKGAAAESNGSKCAGKPIELNESWSNLTKNLNINLDNLLESKSEKPRLSMNQLAAGSTKK
jgi:hypothetical protein